MEKKPMFYGGKVGPWIPVLLMLVGMLASTIIGGGEISRQAIKPISGIQPAFMPSLEMPQIRAVIRPL